MDINTLGIASVASITVICYLVGLLCKTINGVKNETIPVVCGIVGMAIGILWYAMGWADYPASDPVTAAAVGILSGLAATGINQVYKQLNKGE